MDQWLCQTIAATFFYFLNFSQIPHISQNKDIFLADADTTMMALPASPTWHSLQATGKIMSWMQPLKFRRNREFSENLPKYR